MEPLELSPYGAWVRMPDPTPALVRRLEAGGFGTMWLGGSPHDILEIVPPLVDAAEQIVIGTGIVNIWASPAAEIAPAALQLLDRYPDRFLLGIGAGHPEVTDQAARPMDAIQRYLDELDAAGVPRERVLLAALGPKMLRLAAERTAGAHPFLTTPAHSAQARAELGAGPLLVPEQRVVLDDDPEAARAAARASVVGRYFTLSNYRNNLFRLGFTEKDLEGEGSDAVIDAVAAWGSDEQVAARIREHLDAGATQVAVQVLGPAEKRDMAFLRLAMALGIA